MYLGNGGSSPGLQPLLDAPVYGDVARSQTISSAVPSGV